MTDAPRLTDDRLRELTEGTKRPGVGGGADWLEGYAMALELRERRAQQSEGAQAKVVEALEAARTLAICCAANDCYAREEVEDMGRDYLERFAALTPPHGQTEEKR